MYNYEFYSEHFETKHTVAVDECLNYFLLCCLIEIVVVYFVIFMAVMKTENLTWDKFIKKNYAKVFISFIMNISM